MEKINILAKTAGAGDAPDMEKINRQSLREMNAEEIYSFKIAAADTEIDRDNEHFTIGALQTLAENMVGKPIIFDHQWSAKGQTARIYDGAVEENGAGGYRLILQAYLLRSKESESIINAIEGGILREVSVGCAVGKYTCDICGRDYIHDRECMHIKGVPYDDRVCTVSLDDVVDAYEVSFVAVPAQRAAGVTKAFDPENGGSGKETGATAPEITEYERMELALAEARYI